ncbi:beta family protein [Enterobacter kobei]|uniref:beta family protein n=1 Tax=Enterobacter kobei TaxID=208224 RepID=UPI003F56BCEA
MFNHDDNFQYDYAPILSLSPSEMMALEQLPGKDKDNILPVIPLKGWASSQQLENSLLRIEKSIDDRKWVASIDKDYLLNNKTFLFTGKYPREVFYQLKELLQPTNGYDNWYKFLVKTIHAIPVVNLEESSALELQIKKLYSLDRGIVFIFDLKNMTLSYYHDVIRLISKMGIQDLLFIYDIGTINGDYNNYYQPILNLINKTKEKIPFVRVAISGTSFPFNFAGYHRGENPIFERLLFNKLKQNITSYPTIYSDRGSARIEKQSGGGNLPPPRIDYALKNDWRFIRHEFYDPKSPGEGEKEELYSLCAKEIMEQEYWSENLHLWGTQMIELTSKGDKFGINSAQKATAVRINLHLYTQLHYNDELESIDTDEEWED